MLYTQVMAFVDDIQFVSKPQQVRVGYSSVEQDFWTHAMRGNAHLEARRHLGGVADVGRSCKNWSTCGGSCWCRGNLLYESVATKICGVSSWALKGDGVPEGVLALASARVRERLVFLALEVGRGFDGQVFPLLSAIYTTQGCGVIRVD